MLENMKANKSDVIKVLILAAIVIWILCFFIDYFRARQDKTPFFCITESTKEYPDGSVYTCVGLGYKMFRYSRTSISTRMEFGPFFIKERTK